MITGLIDKNIKRKQNFVNSDIIFDTLLKYQPDHILLKITEEEIKRFFSEMTQIDYLYKKKLHSIKLIKLLLFLKRLFIKKKKIKLILPTLIIYLSS